ncbi:MAG: hypothetical protein Kow00122_03040 [Thermoleophilia bacterium]
MAHRTPHSRPRNRHFRLYLRVVCLVLLSLAATGAFFLISADPAEAKGEWIHATADRCGDCHHLEPNSFNLCSDCHDDPAVPNSECTKCHTGKTTTGDTCWTHHEPGEDMPPPTQDNCIACHSRSPHPFAELGADPACTVCHETDPTPHHDAVDQVRPNTCTDCHTIETHLGFPCTVCHAIDTHPSYPTVPSTCFRCHASATFGGQPSCLTCHYGDANFGGVGDNDVHDSTIPDPPISGDSCTSCHSNVQRHAGQIDCTECHFQATPYHHNQASSPGYKACEACHDIPQHGGPLGCTQCHTNAMHDPTPDIPNRTICSLCHQLPGFAVRNCTSCHPSPIYHVPDPTVPSCNSHHGPFQIHDGLPSCESCHSNPASGHHRGSVTIPDCRSCHEQDFHVGQVQCSRCHRNAAHDRSPLNLPSPVWDVCLDCHPFAAKAPACDQCHDQTQHSATYRVPDDCNACHDKKLHAGRVNCRQCHTRIESGHHEDGRVTARDCADCHVGAEIHAVSTAGGRDFTCATCHEREDPHGVQSLPGREQCLECHETAERHAGDLECIQCHWPAAHAATPVAGEFGAFEPLELRLPAPTGDEEIDERAEFTFTGLDLLVYLGLGIGLLLLGLFLRAMSAADNRT